MADTPSTEPSAPFPRDDRPLIRIIGDFLEDYDDDQVGEEASRLTTLILAAGFSRADATVAALAVTVKEVSAERDAAVEEQRAIRHENAVREGWRQDALADRDRLRAVVAELVRLKDCPRDDDWRAARDAAWDRARAELPVPAPGDPSPGDGNVIEMCINGHPFAPGVDVDMEAEGRTPDPRWCNECGDARKFVRDAPAPSTEEGGNDD